MVDSDNADERQSGRGVTVVDALRDRVQGRNCYFVESFTGCGETLPATPVPFGDEGDVLVAPAGDGAALYPDKFGGLQVCAPGNEGVDGDGLPIGDLWWSDLVGFGRAVHCLCPFPFVQLDDLEVVLARIRVKDLTQGGDGFGRELREVVGVHVLGRANRRMPGSGLDLLGRYLVEKADGGERVPQSVDRQLRYASVTEESLVALRQV